MNVTLSIIIPAYNVENYLEDCVHSVISGTYRDFEILLIDDGSTDRTGHICDSLQKECHKIRVFHTENRGLPSARNLGIEKASGQFVGFVDADDLVAPDMFGMLVAAMSPDVQMTACKFRRCQREDIAVHHCVLENYHTANQGDTAEQILRGASGPYVWNKLYRKKIMDAYCFRFCLDSQGCEDLFFNLDYLRYCNKSVFIDEALYYYITRSDSIMGMFRENRTVGIQYISLPRANRYAADVMQTVNKKLVIWAQSRAAMYYQTVLRKLKSPEEAYIQEAVSYVAQHKNTLLHYSWGLKYYLSALVLSVSYPLWERIFRFRK